MTNTDAPHNHPNEHAEREAMVINTTTGNPSLDLDPISLYAYLDVATAWDSRLADVLDAMYAATDATGDGYQLVWSDTCDHVMVECPTCNSITYATSFARVDDDDCVVCSDCRV